MTSQDIIERVKKALPNIPFDDEYIRKLIYDCDRHLRIEIAEEKTGNINLYPLQTLMAPEPYDRIYELYAIAMIQFALGEYDKYNNTASAYADEKEKFAKYYIRNNRPEGRTIKVW
jgi:hypothetical protein